MRGGWNYLVGGSSCDLANSRDPGRLEASPGSFHHTDRLALPENTENVAEGSGLCGQHSYALTPVEKPKYGRVCSEVAVKVKRKKKGGEKKPAVVKDTRMLSSADNNGHG